MIFAARDGGRESGNRGGSERDAAGSGGGEGLVERGFAVHAINPKQLDRFRDRYTVAGAKDDSRDAFVLGDSLRTDQACFHRVQLASAQMLRLRELSRIQEELQV
jgi:Transposase